MILTSLEVEHWRGLRHVHLAEFAPDLTLVAGPNESGKSSLVEALRFALFEPSAGKSAHKRAISAWGTSRTPPIVRVGLQTPEGRWSLTKQFLERPSTTLVGPDGTRTDEEAEARVLSLFAARAAKGRQVRAEDMGLGALLFVPQGESRRPTHEALNEDARAALHGRLSTLVGEVAAGPLGELALRRARDEARLYWGGANGTKPVDRLARALAAHEEAETRRAESERRRAEVHAWSDALARVEESLANAAPEMARVEEQSRAATARAEAVRGLDLELAVITAQRDAAVRAEIRAAEAEAEIARLDARLTELSTTLRTADAAVSGAAERQAEADRFVIHTEEAVVAAATAQEEANQRVERLRARAERDGRRKELRALEQRIEEGAALEARVAELRAAVADNKVDATTISAIRAAASAVDRAAAALDGAAARVRVSTQLALRTDQGAEVAANQELLVTHPLQLRIGDVAEVRIAPGGREMPVLRADLDRARDALGAVLLRAGAPDVRGAERLAAERLEAERDRASEERALQASTGAGGLAALRTAAEQVRMIVARLDAAAAEWEVSDGGLEAADLDAATEHARSMATRLQAARSSRDAAADAARRAAQDLAKVLAARSEVTGARMVVEETRSRLGDADTLRAARTESRNALQAAEEAVTAVQRRRDVLGGTSAADDAERLGRALGNLRTTHDARRAEQAHLRTALDVAGAGGLHEALQAAEAAVDDAARHLAAMQTRADAARRLLDVLERARTTAQERLLGPVSSRLDPYVAEVFPNRAPRVAGQDWSLTGLHGEHEEPFSDLSGGAQEQLAMLVRIAMVEVLAGDSRLPLVLDDSLINTDDARQARLLSILYRASRRLQVIIFTCHPERFATLGQTCRHDLPPLHR